MLIQRRRGWEIPESHVTDERVMRTGRRGVIAGAAIAGGVALLSRPASAQWSLFGFGRKSAPAAAQTLKPLSAPLDDKYQPGRPTTDAKDATTYNNYYEFSDYKDLADDAQALKMDPWSIEIAGMVSKPRTIGFEDLMKQVSLQERITRHRCVEAWAMTVPWIGFPLADFVKLAEPLGSASYVVFTTVEQPKAMAGLHKTYYPWPYIDGVTMQEAMNDLAFLSVGMYGKSLPPQNGGPIRLNTPWKYGFKQVKAIVKVEFTDKRPTSFWESLASSEYGFWANVNPDVPHPRWSQAHERLLGTDEMVPTRIWNGYGEFVASMYDDKKNERLFA
jgi:sulfoxide reductase catalytic subunit YedY